MSSEKACCSLPPVQADYTPKGSYSDVNGLKSYIIGEESSKKVILVVYDIFGYSPQILQGADLLASQGFRVIMPDFLVGKYATPNMFDGSEEGNKARNEFFSGFPGAIDSQLEPVRKTISSVKTSDNTVGVVGYCWGYKVLVKSDSKDYAALAGAHPSFAAADDADHVSKPLALLASKDEDKAVMKQIYEAAEAKNSGKNVLKTYDTVPHGWMAARADFKDKDASAQYVDGYETLVKFLKANL